MEQSRQLLLRFYDRVAIILTYFPFPVKYNIMDIIDFLGGTMGKENACQVETQVQTLSPGLPGVANCNYFSILPWKIPWTDKPGGLQSMGSQKSQIWLNIHIHMGIMVYGFQSPVRYDILR